MKKKKKVRFSDVWVILAIAGSHEALKYSLQEEGEFLTLKKNNGINDGYYIFQEANWSTILNEKTFDIRNPLSEFRQMVDYLLDVQTRGKGKVVFSKAEWVSMRSRIFRWIEERLEDAKRAPRCEYFPDYTSRKKFLRKFN